MPSADDLARSALGALWPRLLDICHEWMRVPRAREERQLHLSEADLLSFEIGAYLYTPGDVVQFGVRYESTPRHSYIFATTGADGVHFSVSVDSDSQGVVVVTVPMNFDAPNVVVGESMHDFLGLVCFGGFDLPAQAASVGFGRAEREIRALVQEERRSELLVMLQERLGVQPWSHIEARLIELQARYARLSGRYL